MKKLFVFLAVLFLVAESSLSMAACLPGYEYVGSTSAGQEICCPKGVGRCGNRCCTRGTNPTEPNPPGTGGQQSPHTGWATLRIQNDTNVSLNLYVDGKGPFCSTLKGLGCNTHIRSGWHSFEAVDVEGKIVSSGNRFFNPGDSFTWTVAAIKPPEPEPNQDPDEDENFEILIIFQNFFDQGIRFYVDEKFICKVEPGEDCETMVTPGTHTLKAINDSGQIKVRKKKFDNTEETYYWTIEKDN